MKTFSPLWAAICLLAAFGLLLTGCAGTPMQFNPQLDTPQIIVEPGSIRLGIARLVNDTRIVFQGTGFEPGDSVFINIVDVKKDDETTDVPIADAVVDPEGNFRTEVTKIVKITELLRADVGLNDEMENYIIVTQDPIPAGKYVVRAESMETDKQAECPFEISGPSVMDSFKDWIGGLLGKIEKQ